MLSSVPNVVRTFRTSWQHSIGSLAIVRGVPDSFDSSLCMEKPSDAINVEKAREQHAAYVSILKGLVQEVVEISSDERFPDCPFIEDTAVVIGSRALITRPGAAERQGEEEAVKKVMHSLDFHVTTVQAPATIDGGDVLHYGGHLFVGLGSRTNKAGMLALQSAFPDIPVVGVPMTSRTSLHLKSVISWAGGSILPVESTKGSREIFNLVQKHVPSAESFEVDENGAALCLFIGGQVLYPSAYTASSFKYQERFSNGSIPVDLSEFHKADGGMTCLSIIVE